MDPHSCPELQRCLLNATSATVLHPWNASRPKAAGPGENYDGGLVAYFAIFYFLYYATGWSGLGLPPPPLCQYRCTPPPPCASTALSMRGGGR